MKKVLAIFLTIVLSIAVVYAADSFIQISIQEKYNVSTGIYQLSLNDSGNYYDLINLNTISSSQSVNSSIEVFNEGDVEVYYDIVIKTNVDDLKVSYEGVTITLVKDKADLLYESTNKLIPENSHIINLTIINSTTSDIFGIELEVFILFRESSPGENSTNCYIKKEYDLRKALNSFSLNDKDSSKYKIPHFILLNDLELTEELTINLPSTIDLLDNDLILKANFKIIHHYYGVYYINAIDGLIDNDDNSFVIETPNSFYEFSDYTIIKKMDNFNDVFTNASKDKVDYALKSALIYLESLFLYDFMDFGVKKYAVVQDLVLPKTFFNYPINYNFSTSNEDVLHPNGHANRMSTDITVILSVSLTYKKTLMPDYNKNYQMLVVGDGDEAVFKQTVRLIEKYINDALSRDAFKYGVSLPSTSMFDENMVLFYTLANNDYLALNGNVIGTTRKTIVNTVINLDVKYMKAGITAATNQIVPISLIGCTHAEKVEELNQVFGPVYFVETSFYNLFTTNLKTMFGIQSVQYELLAYKQDENTLEYIYDADLSENLFDMLEFDFTSADADKVRVPSYITFQVADDEKIELKVNVTWVDQQANTTHIYPITVPASGGYGGEGELQNLQDVLQSAFSENAYTITSFTFERKIKDVYVSLGFASDSQGLSFCKIIQDTNYCTIEIDPSKIPITNTTVSFIASVTVPNEPNPILQDYFFVIPGIYRLGADEKFKDEILYNVIKTIIRSYKQGSYSESIWGRLENDDLLFDYVFNDALILIENLDITNLGVTNLSGIEYMKTLKKLYANQNPLTGSNKLMPLNQLMLSEVYLSDCNITNSDLLVFRNLIELVILDLSRNKITALHEGGVSYFYRRITKLYLNEQENLRTIDGIEKLPNLIEVHLQNNKIAIFGPLLNLEKIKYVYLGNNIDVQNVTNLYNQNKAAVSISNPYGTYGSLNKTTFVELTARKVSIYDYDNSLITINSDELAVHQAANAIFCYEHVYNVGGRLFLGIYDITMKDKYVIEFYLPTNDFIYNVNSSNNTQSISINQNAVNSSFVMYLKVSVTVDPGDGGQSQTFVAYRQVIVTRG